MVSEEWSKGNPPVKGNIAVITGGRAADNTRGDRCRRPPARSTAGYA